MLVMELQLGLALPISSTPIIKGFDLNFHAHEPKDNVGSNSLNHQFGSIMSNTETYNDCCRTNKKRSFGEVFELNTSAAESPTLPLLRLWNNQPNEDEDDPKNVEKNSSFMVNKNGGDDVVVVGWPPVKKFRKRLLCNFNKSCRSANNRTMENSSKYVKVKMEGDGIARKIDLNRYYSYQTLSDTLIGMFDKCQENGKEYILTYQDSEGDWLLAGDVPWRTFIGSAQRLRLLKRSD